MRAVRLPLSHSLFSVVLALFVLGLYGVFLLLGQLILEEAQAGLEYRIHLYNPIAQEQVEELLSWLQRQNLVQKVEYISPEQAMEGFRKVVGEEFVRAMEGFNPFPPTFRLTFKGEKVSSDSVLVFTQRVLEWESVKEVDYPRRLLEILEKRASTLRWVGLGVGIIMVGITFLLIFNTVRLAIFARRLEIRTMELVGATRSYIERPFVLVGLFQGLVGAVLAIVLLQGGMWLLHKSLFSLSFLLEDWRLLGWYGVLVVFGGVVGYLASKLALRRFLHQTLDKLI
ncbi:MAG: permease-like cell division protein FtsX [Bacteroidia bacterium]|nr:permease-like cell division protein FtsX [Bacteroidia bacterium]MDW8133490.1 permease-like cell division protein FtsX [Bacteroidia bacterium]